MPNTSNMGTGNTTQQPVAVPVSGGGSGGGSYSAPSYSSSSGDSSSAMAASSVNSILPIYMDYKAYVQFESEYTRNVLNLTSKYLGGRSDSNYTNFKIDLENLVGKSIQSGMEKLKSDLGSMTPDAESKKAYDVLLIRINQKLGKMDFSAANLDNEFEKLIEKNEALNMVSINQQITSHVQYLTNVTNPAAETLLNKYTTTRLKLQ